MTWHAKFVAPVRRPWARAGRTGTASARDPARQLRRRAVEPAKGAGAALQSSGSVGGFRGLARSFSARLSRPCVPAPPLPRCAVAVGAWAGPTHRVPSPAARIWHVGILPRGAKRNLQGALRSRSPAAPHRPSSRAGAMVDQSDGSGTDLEDERVSGGAAAEAAAGAGPDATAQPGEDAALHASEPRQADSQGGAAPPTSRRRRGEPAHCQARALPDCSWRTSGYPARRTARQPR